MRKYNNNDYEDKDYYDNMPRIMSKLDKDIYNAHAHELNYIYQSIEKMERDWRKNNSKQNYTEEPRDF